MEAPALAGGSRSSALVAGSGALGLGLRPTLRQRWNSSSPRFLVLLQKECQDNGGISLHRAFSFFSRRTARYLHYKPVIDVEKIFLLVQAAAPCGSFTGRWACIRWLRLEESIAPFPGVPSPCSVVTVTGGSISRSPTWASLDVQRLGENLAWFSGPAVMAQRIVEVLVHQGRSGSKDLLCVFQWCWCMWMLISFLKASLEYFLAILPAWRIGWGRSSCGDFPSSPTR
jgi:hypothetical protein